MSALTVLAFGTVGVAVRFGLYELVKRWATVPLPAATLGINVLGSFAIGCVAALASGNTRTALTVGLLGGFTTFSAYSLEALTLWETKQHTFAVLYAVGSPLLGIAAAFAGMALARSY